ncbi:MAG: YqeG family HAD IIIA-type phosphatase [Eggerthellaceae bacterium]|nr:YqeG family HAD IIIA-type phosphatase [Eggerthellaceae bacterium]
MPLMEADRYFSRVSLINIRRDLIGVGLEHVLIDVDNTIVNQETHEFPRDTGIWLGHARDAGIKFCLVSGAVRSPIIEIANELKLPYISKMFDPMPHKFITAMNKIGGVKLDTVVIGDQLVNDVLCAHLAGLTAYMLQPMVEQDALEKIWEKGWDTYLLRHRRPEPAASLQGDGQAMYEDRHCFCRKKKAPKSKYIKINDLEDMDESGKR